MEKRYGIDLLKIYIGVEHFNELDEDGNIIESKEIDVYFLDKKYYSNSSCRLFLINLETGDDIEIDQHGEVVGYESETRDILDVTELQSLKETIPILLESVKPIIQDMENGVESLDYFITLNDHMINMEQENNPAYLEADCLEGLVGMASNIYTLSYGNPLTKENKMRCLYRFAKGGKKDGV